MPTGVDRQLFKETLKSQVELQSTTDFEVADFRKQSADIFKELGAVSFFDDPANEAELSVSLNKAKQEGLMLADVVAALREVRVHVSAQAHFEALRAHEEASADAVKHRQFGTLIKLKYKDVKTVFGGGVADDVRERATAVQVNNNMMRELLNGALEMAIMRKRLERYQSIAGADLTGVLAEYRSGHSKNGEVITSSQLLDVRSEQGQKYDQALDKIIAELHIEAGPGKTIHIEGISPDVEVPDEVTKQAYEHHFKFILRTEIIKLVDAEKLTALSSEEYNLIHGKGAWEKAWQVGKGVATSGTLWGVVTRAGTRLAIGGLVSAALVSGGPAIIGGIVVGAGAGALAGYARERVNAKDRLKRRKLEAALGAIDDGAAKPAKVINKELKEKVLALQAAHADNDKVKQILEVFKVATETEVRLRTAHQEQQDYISFGVDNRFKAQKQLLDNLEISLAAVQLALDELPESDQIKVRNQMVQINKESGLATQRALEVFHNKVHEDEKRRQGRAAIVGALGGGLGSLVGHYLAELGSYTANAVASRSEFGAKLLNVLVPRAEAAENLVPQHVINVDGRASLIQLADKTRYALVMDAQHHLTISRYDQLGDHFVSEHTLNLPASIDALKVIESPTGAQLVDGNGNVIALLEQPAATAAATTNPTEEWFANTQIRKLLDAMGLQPGDVHYNAATNSFEISDAALHDAAGGVEYLGQTAGWRAHRMEFLLRALRDPAHANESPAMLVARAERATSNLILSKGEMHGDAAKAYAEAFNKDGSFIQRNVMPWVDGTRSRVSSKWIHLVAELQKHPATVASGSGQLQVRLPEAAAPVANTPAETVAGSALETSAEATTTNLPSQLPEAAVPGVDAPTDAATDGAIGTGTETSTTGVVSQSASEAAYDGLMSRHVQEVGILLTALLTTGAHLMPAPDIAHRPTHPKEHSTDTDDEFHVRETQLKSIPDTVIEMKQVADEKLKREKSANIIIEINQFISTADAVMKSGRTDLDRLRVNVLAGGFENSHLDLLVAHADTIDQYNKYIADAVALLNKEDAGLKYVDFDHAQGGKLAAWLQAHEVYQKFPDEVKSKISAKVNGQIQLARSIRMDMTIPPADKRSALNDIISSLAFVNRLGELAPKIVADYTWRNNLENETFMAEREIRGACALLTISERIGADPNVKSHIEAVLQANDCYDATDPTLPSRTRRLQIIRLAKEMAAFPEGKEGLEQMQFRHPSKRPNVGKDQKSKMDEVLGRLFRDETPLFV